MDTLSAFAMGEINRNNPMRVFDWHKAAQLIRDRKPTVASAGLGEDWEWTGDTIYRDGKPVAAEDCHAFLASTWAIPELDLDGEIIDCYIMKDESPGWDTGTIWPQSALDILHGVTNSEVTP